MATGLKENDAVVGDPTTIKNIYKLAREIGVMVYKDPSYAAEDYMTGGKNGFGGHDSIVFQEKHGLVPCSSVKAYKVHTPEEFIARMYITSGKEPPAQDRASILKERIAKLRV